MQISPAIQISNLQCIRSERIIFSKINFSLDAGEILWVTGANGSGKSSLLRMICGLLQPFTGEIYITPSYRSLLYLGHKIGINAKLTCLENLRLFSMLQLSQTQFNINEILQQLNLWQYRHTLAKKLSAGQQQRIALAKLFLSSAKFWILDEPLTALDSSVIEIFNELLQTHIKNSGVAIIASHQTLSLTNTKELQLNISSEKHLSYPSL